MNSTYSKNSIPNLDAEKLLELWEAIGETGLFKLEVSFDSGRLTHEYFFKEETIKLHAQIINEDYSLTIYDTITGMELSSGEFWDLLSTENKKVLAFHLDQLI